MNNKEILKAIEKSTLPKFKNEIFGTSNSKLMKQGIISFDLPAIKTCHFANDCVNYCYADKIQKRYKNARLKWLKNEQISLQSDFVDIANNSLKALPNTKFVRIHSSGDFYSRNYLAKWLQIAEDNKNTIFYAYTKAAIYFKSINLPPNFLVCQSLPLVKKSHYQSHLQHAQIFYSLESYNNAIEYGNYIGAKDEDLEAVKAMIQGKNIALLDHKLKNKLARQAKKELINK